MALGVQMGPTTDFLVAQYVRVCNSSSFTILSSVDFRIYFSRSLTSIPSHASIFYEYYECEHFSRQSEEKRPVTQCEKILFEDSVNLPGHPNGKPYGSVLRCCEFYIKRRSVSTDHLNVSIAYYV